MAEATLPPAVVLATTEGGAPEPAAHRLVCGLTGFERALLAAHHAGCETVWLVVEEGEEALDEFHQALEDDPRFDEVAVGIVPFSDWQGGELGLERDPIVLDGSEVVDTRHVEAQAGGTDGGLKLPGNRPESDLQQQMLRQLPNPCDGLVDTWLNRPISRRLTPLFIKLGFTPNQVTVLSFLVGMLGVSAIAFGSWTWGIVGALLFQFSAALDCVDGEIARLCYLSSPFGARLDLTLDNVVHVCLFLAMAYQSTSLLGPGNALAWGLAAGAGGLISFLIVYWLTFGGRRPGGRLQSFLDGITNRDFSLLIIAFAIWGRWDILVRVIAVGTNGFALLLLGVLIADRQRGGEPS